MISSSDLLAYTWPGEIHNEPRGEDSGSWAEMWVEVVFLGGCKSSLQV